MINFSSSAKPFGTKDATMPSAQNVGKGFVNSQGGACAYQIPLRNPFVHFNAQGTGNGFGFGK